MSKSHITTAFGEYYFSNPLLPIHVCRVNRQKGLTHPHDLTATEHIHDFIEIVVIMGGSGTQVIQNESYPVSMGDVFVLQGLQSHYFSEFQSLDIINIMLDPIRNKDLLSPKIRKMSSYQALFVLEPQRRNEQRFRNLLRLGHRELKEIEPIIHSIQYELTQREEGFELLSSHLLEVLVLQLSRAYNRLEKPNALGMMRIHKVIDFLNLHFDQQHSIEELASMACMSPRHFQRVFKLHTGTSPVSYLHNLRIKYACELLKRNELSVMEVAFEVGFQDRSYFTKLFKKIVGIQPKKFHNSN
jgi:AraC family L-rhamnose operon transcriptional activator RhaR